ncbi:MAG: TonB-dependent receptor [Cyclobacteriaceae bacterium]|jgi:iron complex outermembrane receptor protein
MVRVLLWIAVLKATVGFSQFEIRGSITHHDTGLPVVGAYVILIDRQSGTSSDAGGRYRFGNVPPGVHTLEVKYVGHKTLIRQIDLSADTTLNFILEDAVMSLDEVIVSGSAQQVLVRESPIPVQTLNASQWMMTGSTNLVDAVSRLPGMSQIQTGPALAKPVIRGLAFNRVITMHDGIRQEDNQWGEEHSLQIDEYSIDRYEIIRGAGSLMYGSDGLGGVVSILSPRSPEAGTVRGNILSTYQTNSGLFGFSGFVNGNTNGKLFMLRASQKNSTNYRNAYDGRVYGSNFRENLNVNGMLGVQKKWGYSKIYFLKWRQEINIIDGTRDINGSFTRPEIINGQEVLRTVTEEELTQRSINPANSQDLSNYKISSNNMFNIGSGALAANIGYSENHRREFANLERPGEPDLYFFLQTVFYDVRYHFPERNNWEVTLGTNGMRQAMTNRGNEVLYPNYHLFDNGVFLFAKKKINRLAVSGGVRHDVRSLHIDKLYLDANGRFQSRPENSVAVLFPGFDKQFLNVTGSMGAVYNVHDHLYLKANIARGFRAPSVPEISSNGEHAGTFRYEIGNINQQSETSLQTDIGITYERPQFFADLTLFNNRIDQYTYSEKVNTASGQDSLINGVPVFRYTQGDANLKGLEASATFNPATARWLELSSQYSLVLTENRSAKTAEERYLPFMPAGRTITRLKLSKEKIGRGMRNGSFFVEWEHHADQERYLAAFNTETRTPGYSLINTGVAFDLVNEKQETLFSLYFTANNVFDIAFQSHQSRLKYLDVNPATGRAGVFNMGRNVSIRLAVPLELRAR